MRKTFDANVSRLKPRTRLGALLAKDESMLSMPLGTVESIAERVANEAKPTLAESVKARIVQRADKPTAAQALAQAIDEPPVMTEATAFAADRALEAERRMAAVHAAPTPPVSARIETVPAPVAAPPLAPMVSHATVAVTQTLSPSAAEVETAAPAERRERLKERLKAVREHPRPEPLPDTVAEAGVLAVERISALQTELTRVRALNLALTQDLEGARRQAERATEEARTRMDEARRLASEMEGRAKLLTELEAELESLEAERNEALLSLQDSRQQLDLAAKRRVELEATLDAKNTEVDECLAEEERLAGEVERAQKALTASERTNTVLKTERDTLARQVADLTRERTELLEARKALEAVHRALSQAVSR